MALTKVIGQGIDSITVDSSGNVGIGVSSPAHPLSVENPDGNTNTISMINNSSNLSRLAFVQNGSTTAAYSSIDADGRSTGFIRFNTNDAEAMRIDSSGNLLVGVAVTPDGSDTGVALMANGNFNQTKGSNMMNLYRGGTGSVVTFRQGTIGGSFTSVGTISVTGSATAYNTSSDYRLKENVTAEWDATTRLKQLNPVRFNFIAEPDTTVDGFLAHEVQDIVPEAISGTKDAMRDEEYEVTPAVFDEDGNEVTPAVMGTRSVPDYQGIDQSKLVPLLAKTIQELEARIAALENA